MTRISLLILLVLSLESASADEAAFWEGVRSFEAGDHGAAARHFEDAVREDPGDATSYLWLGMSYHRLGRSDSARAAFEKAARLGDPQVAAQARASLRALPGGTAPAAGSGPGQASAAAPAPGGARKPAAWQTVGSIQGLDGQDWRVRDTQYCRVWARQGDLAYVEEFVGELDRAYALNARFMGVRAVVPINFYCFPLSSPAHLQPRFAGQVAGWTRFAGLAVGDDLCLINLGDWRGSYHYEPWDVARTACHELNHMFFNSVDFSDPSGQRTWLAEALAAAVEDRLLPTGRQRTLESVRLALKGYHSADVDWRALVAERNNDELEQYRTYGTLLASIVYFFEARFGSDAVARLLQAARGASLDEAFVVAFGRDVPALHEEWRGFYRIR